MDFEWQCDFCDYEFQIEQLAGTYLETANDKVDAAAIALAKWFAVAHVFAHATIAECACVPTDNGRQYSHASSHSVSTKGQSN